MSNDELQDQYRRCVTWNDPEQWDALAAMYLARGYELNAAACVEKADELRANLGLEISFVE